MSDTVAHHELGGTSVTPEERLRALGIEIPEAQAAAGNYVQCVRVGSLVFTSGHGPNRKGWPRWRGKLGTDLTPEQGYAAARAVALNLLASLRSEVGELSRVRRVVKLHGMVNCTPDFEEQPRVMNGASDLLVEAFGERGRHARTAMGAGALPGCIPVEIEMIVEVE